MRSKSRASARSSNRCRSSSFHGSEPSSSESPTIEKQVVAIVDLRRLFGLSPQHASRRTKWIILETTGTLVGVVVDAVLDVFSSAEDHAA